jgi:hypothetical protein
MTTALQSFIEALNGVVTEIGNLGTAIEGLNGLNANAGGNANSNASKPGDPFNAKDYDTGHWYGSDGTGVSLGEDLTPEELYAKYGYTPIKASWGTYGNSRQVGNRVIFGTG